MSEIPAGFGQVNILMAYGFAFTDCMTSFGIQADGDASDIAEDIHQAVDGTLNSFITSAVGFTGVEVITPTIIGESTGGVIAGAISAESTPPNVAILAKKLTGLRGRSNNGRNFFPGIQESNVNDDGDLDAGFLAGVQTGLDDFYDAVTAITGVTEVVLLHAEGSVQAPVLMSGWLASSKVATQRRRLKR